MFPSDSKRMKSLHVFLQLQENCSKNLLNYTSTLESKEEKINGIEIYHFLFKLWFSFYLEKIKKVINLLKRKMKPEPTKWEINNQQNVLPLNFILSTNCFLKFQVGPI